MNRFERFIGPMNLPGTTNLSAFGHSELLCFKRETGQKL